MTSLQVYQSTRQIELNWPIQNLKMLPLISLEDHFVSPTVRAAAEQDNYVHFPPKVMTQLLSLDAERITEMDAGKVTLQIVSHAPINASLENCRTANDELAEGVKKNPTRLGGFAMLPMSDPQGAATELERCVKSLGFAGALINNHLDGEFYDDAKFWPVFAKAEELDIPIYIHPTFATEDELDITYRGNYSEGIAKIISGRGWGWHTETGLHVLRLFSSGLFDAHPKVKLIIGHMGELLPFQLDRIYPMTEGAGSGGIFGHIKRGLREVWKENIWVTTSGMFTLAPFACLLRTTDISKIMFSVDYPFADNRNGLKFMEALIESKMVSEKEVEMISYQNAQDLLGVKAIRD